MYSLGIMIHHLIYVFAYCHKIKVINLAFDNIIYFPYSCIIFSRIHFMLIEIHTINHMRSLDTCWLSQHSPVKQQAHSWVFVSKHCR